MVKTNKILGLISLDEDNMALGQLTSVRPVASIPFGGRYRIIDFVLSNMVNAGISTVGIYLNDKERSLMDHLRSGKPWDLDGNKGGLFVFSPFSTPSNVRDLKGDIMTFYNNIDILDKACEKYVLISGSTMVANIDYTKVLDEHIKNGNEITVVYKNFDKLSHYYDNAFVLNEDGEKRVTSFGLKIVRKSETEEVHHSAKVSLNMYLMETKIFRELIEKAVAEGKNIYLREVLQDACRNHVMKGYEFSGFLGFINSVKNYYKTSMDLLNEKNLLDLFYGDSRIITKVKNESPAYYSKDSNVTNSLIANGCEIEGEVKNSIIFRRVKVEKGAKIENSIIMQNSVIKKGADISYAIIDKNVEVSSKTEIKGSKKQPLVIEKGSLV